MVESPEGRVFEVVYGPRSIVRQVFGPNRIAGASAQTLYSPRRRGWGYRGGPRPFRRAAVVTRRGPALEPLLEQGRRITVTVDDPEDFVRASSGDGA